MKTSVVLIVTWALLVTASGIAYGETCEQPSEKAIVDKILATDYQGAFALADQLHLASSIIPSKDFYYALANWYQGYQLGDKKRKKSAIGALRQAIKQLDEELKPVISSQNNLPAIINAHLALGLAKGHGARILLEGEYIYRGYKMATAALKHLNLFFSKASPDIPGYYDAEFLRGLYEIYTHDLKERYNWLTGSIDYKGNRKLGIALIERMINKPSIFSIEAIKALLAEVSWQLPQVCKYRDVVDLIGSQFKSNRDYMVLRQGLLLKCGSAERALAVNTEYKNHPQHPELIQRLLTKAELRIKAHLGRAEEIQQITVFPDQQADQLLAMANALDIQGNRNTAIDLYKKINSDKTIIKTYRAVARARLQYPFKSAAKRNVSQFLVSPCTYYSTTSLL